MADQQEPQITQPGPTTVTVAAAPVLMSDGSKWARCHVFSCTGEFIFFLPPESAESVGEQLRKIGREGKSGIVAAPSSLVVPGK